MSVAFIAKRITDCKQNVTFTRCIIADIYYDIMTTKICKVTLPFDFSVLSVREKQFLVCSWWSVMRSDHTNSYSHNSQDMSDIGQFVLCLILTGQLNVIWTALSN